MTAYFAPTYNNATVSWVGAESYTAPSANPLNISYFGASPLITGDISLAFQIASISTFGASPANIVGGVVLGVTPNSQMTHCHLMEIGNSMFEVQPLIGSMVVSQTEAVDLDALLPSLTPDIQFLEAFGITSSLPGFTSDILLTLAGNVAVESELAGFISDFVLYPRGTVDVDGLLPGLIMDALVYEARDMAFSGTLTMLSDIGFAIADNVSVQGVFPALQASLQLEDSIGFGGYLAAPRFDLEVLLSSEIVVEARLPTLQGAMQIDTYKSSIECKLPGLNAKFVVDPNGDISFYNSLKLIGHCSFDPPEDAAFAGVLAGLSFEGLRDNGLEFEHTLPHLRGERVFNTATDCRTGYL